MTRSLIVYGCGLAALLVAALVAMASTTAMAHEDEELGGYKLVVGFLHEPAYEGEMNAVSIRVTKGTGGEGEESSEMETAALRQPPSGHGPEPVGIEGLQNTLLVEVTHVPSSVSKAMNLRPVSNDPGHYVADLIPTSPGHYRFRFFGTIEGEQTDVTFDSMAGGGDFDDVQPATAIHFPDAVVSARELESAVRGLQTTVGEMQEMQVYVAAAQPPGMPDESEDSDAAAATMAIIGIVLGVGGIALGGVSLVVVIRRGKS